MGERNKGDLTKYERGAIIWNLTVCPKSLYNVKKTIPIVQYTKLVIIKSLDTFRNKIKATMQDVCIKKTLFTKFRNLGPLWGSHQHLTDVYIGEVVTSNTHVRILIVYNHKNIH